jgi:hypothetical protein
MALTPQGRHEKPGTNDRRAADQALRLTGDNASLTVRDRQEPRQ